MKFHYREKVNEGSGWLKLISYIVPVVILFGAIGWFGVSRWYNNNLQPLDGTSQQSYTFIVEPGTSVREISSRLEDEGIIKSSTVFAWYVDRNDKWSDLQAGTYSLSPSMSVETIVTKLATGDIDTSLVTIFPGRRLDQIADDLLEIGYSQSEVDQALARSYTSTVLDDKPPGASLEGYLYPETYQVTEEMALSDVFQRSLDEFDTRVTPQLRQALIERGLNLHEAVTLASIIYKESSDEPTQRKIAGVFFNRLELDMPLGADPTFVYAAAISNQPVSPDIDSPYNTRIVKGLPPGPISNFTYPALAAVANPDKTEDLYFVAGDDGMVYFAQTLEEHVANIDKHCTELCNLPLEN